MGKFSEIDIEVKNFVNDIGYGAIIRKNYYTPVKIFYEPPVTRVLWKDDTETIVKTSDEDDFQEDHGFAMALAKKIFTTRGYFNAIVERDSIKVEEEVVVVLPWWKKVLLFFGFKDGR